VGECLKKSTTIGDAFSSMPMPAVTLRHSTSHRHQNCGVLMALAAETFAVVIMTLPLVSGEGCQPAGRQPSRGTRTRNTPSDMNIAQRGPLRSTRVPPKAADKPSITIASWNGSELSVPDRPSDFSSGVLNTLHAYAWPIDRWTDSAAGGISQRLQFSGATVRE